MSIHFLFAWYDLWVGAFYDKKNNWLYILPVPMIGLIIKLPERRYWLISNYDDKSVIGSTVKSELEHCCRVDNVHSKMYWAKNGDTAPLFGKDYNEE
jgi:hypothetical protein